MVGLKLFRRSKLRHGWPLSSATTCSAAPLPSPPSHATAVIVRVQVHSRRHHVSRPRRHIPHNMTTYPSLWHPTSLITGSGSALVYPPSINLTIPANPSLRRLHVHSRPTSLPWTPQHSHPHRDSKSTKHPPTTTNHPLRSAYPPRRRDQDKFSLDTGDKP
jgi:hypothetical protein